MADQTDSHDHPTLLDRYWLYAAAAPRVPQPADDEPPLGWLAALVATVGLMATLLLVYSVTFAIAPDGGAAVQVANALASGVVGYIVVTYGTGPLWDHIFGVERVMP